FDSCPLISVIVPIYNVEKYLDRCVESIVNQTYKNLEIILVDDGSPDNCPAMCDNWAHKDSRIRVIHKQNGGLSSARNAGIDAAHGEYLGFIDSDDYILPEMYEVLLKLILENDADLSVCSFQRVDEDGMPLQDDSKELEAKVLIGGEILTEWMKGDWRYALVVTKLCKAELFHGLRFLDGRLHEDEFIAHHFLRKCRKSASTSARMYMYTQRSDSIMGQTRTSFSAKRFIDAMDSYKDRYSFFIDIGRKDLADFAAMQACRFINGELKHASYLKNRQLFNDAIGFAVKRCLISKNFLIILRVVKLFLLFLRNIAKDIPGKL
ncbi:MAG: glycosyltransferase, partial [Synergistaceae bacterium]|nr:glycosyltransferase [Synergistaceae bacterium]